MKHRRNGCHNNGQKRKDLNSAYGHVANQLGWCAETLVERSLRLAKHHELMPEWLWSWTHYKQNSREDAGGADFRILTDVGAFMLNIKSSEAGKEKFGWKNHSHRMDAVVIDVRWGVDQIYNKIENAVIVWRDKQFPKMKT